MDDLIAFGRHCVWVIPGFGFLIVSMFLVLVTIALFKKRSVVATCSFRKISFSIEAHDDEPKKKHKDEDD